jgi:hypothetical protein
MGVFLQIAFPPNVPGQVGRPAKTSKAPRALGLLELAPNGKAHLIPITILIDGKYYDASAYKAAPVPMALWSETVYEAVRTGVSQGLFTVTGALQTKDAKDGNEWMAEGTWQSADSIKAKAAKKPEASEPRGLHEDEGPPVLRRAGADKPKPTEPPAAAPTAPPPAPPVASPPAVAAPQAAPATSGSTASSATPAPQEPANHDQPPEDKDRPTLKRGKPKPAPAAKEEPREEPGKTPAASAKTIAPSTAKAPTNPAKNSASSSGSSPANQIQLIPAISDSDGPDPRPYTYSLKPEDEQPLRKKMLALAADEVRARVAQLSSPSASGGSTTPVHTSSQRTKAAVTKPVQPDFEDVQLRGFDLANINEPELVLTATARMPQRPHEKESAGTDLRNKDLRNTDLQNKDLQNKDLQNKDLQNKDLQNKDLQYMVTLVARQDVNGELHKALANITDTQHLEVLPRLELIDAVDADGDGRGELLFRQVSDAGSAFVVYRVIGDRLYPLFQGTLGH